MLENVKVIEYGNLISGPFCSKILGDLGAEVIKIEEPDKGDDARRCEPFLGDIPNREWSGLFLYLNMNKLGITLNLRTPTGKEIFAELVKDADIFIENNQPAKMEEIGITYEYVKQINRNIVMTSISPFGQTGPYKNYKSCELVNANISGVSYASTREFEMSQPPLKPPAHILGFQAGISAAAITLGALYRSDATGSGDHLDVSEQESAIQDLGLQIPQFCYRNHIVSRTDAYMRAPFHVLPCKDGYIYHAFVHEYQWRRFLELMGNPDWADNELFKDYETRAKYWDGLRPLMVDWTMNHTMDEIYRKSQEKGAPVGAVYTAKEILDSEQLAARGFFVEAEHEAAGNQTYPGVPYKFSEVVREMPISAPLLGQHNEEIICGRLGYKRSDLVKLKEAGII